MTTPQMTADTVPPAAEGVPEAPVPAELTPEEERKRRRRKAIILFLLLGLLGILLMLLLWYFLFRQPLPVVPPIPEAQLPGYSTSLYGATSPIGVAVTPAGDRIYVAESGGDRVVRILDANGNTLGTMVPPAETGRDHVPVYVAIDPLTTEVYVSDRPTGSVYIYDRDGRFQRQFNPAEPIPGWQPMGLAFDDAGNLYVTDLGGPSDRIEVFDRSGVLIRSFGDGAGLSFPNGIALDAAGNVYVADSNNGRLLIFAQSGELVGRVGRGSGVGKLGLPRGVAIDGSDRVFVVDTTAQGVAVYRALVVEEPQPEYLGIFGSPGVDDGQFSFPVGSAVDDRGRVYIADTANDRVQVWSY
ncbi:MAG TPA: hypothetical protein VLA23_13585 [Candidatus Limnocylindrales bacterium]|nr:hypothetical protein [Candidatus Limnocylindrales bacterium]